MRTIQQIFGDTSPKNVEKITKGFEKGESLQYMNAVIAEAAKSTAIDFQKLRCLITDNYHVDYSLFHVLSNRICVVPLSQISTLYRSNIVYCEKPQYDYECFNLTLELKNGTKVNCNRIMRNEMNPMNAYDEIIALVKTKVSKEEV